MEEPSASNIRSETPEGAASLPIPKSPQVKSKNYIYKI